MLFELSAWQAMRVHARSAYPAEACGLLAGPVQGHVSQSLPLPNIARGLAYLADPYQQYLAERQVQRAGLQLIGVYHSHPDGTATLSAADRQLARPELMQVVISVAGPLAEPQEIRGYSGPESFNEVELRVRPA